jgi:hypothetical protein
MKYLLLICAEGTVCDEREEPRQEGEGGPDDIARASACAPEWPHGRGILVTGSPAQPSVEATLQFRGDGVLITDGPYAHVQGHIQGFDVIDCEQLEEVIELATRAPGHWAGQPEQPGTRM